MFDRFDKILTVIIKIFIIVIIALGGRPSALHIHSQGHRRDDSV